MRFTPLPREHSVFSPEGRGKFALVIVPDAAGNLCHGERRFRKKLGCALHAVLADMRGKRGAVYGLKDRLEGGRVDMKLPRQKLDGETLIEMLNQIFMNLSNQRDLIRPAVRQQGTLLRTGNTHHLLDDLMQQPCGFCFRSVIENLTSFAPASNASFCIIRANSAAYTGESIVTYCPG